MRVHFAELEHDTAATQGSRVVLGLNVDEYQFDRVLALASAGELEVDGTRFVLAAGGDRPRFTASATGDGAQLIAVERVV